MNIFFLQKIWMVICFSHIFAIMIARDYKLVDYKQFIDAVSQSLEKSGKSFVQVAAELDVKSPTTIKNCFSVDSQKASDSVLTRVAGLLNIDGFITWDNGKRYYYIKRKRK